MRSTSHVSFLALLQVFLHRVTSYVSLAALCDFCEKTCNASHTMQATSHKAWNRVNRRWLYRKRPLIALHVDPVKRNSVICTIAQIWFRFQNLLQIFRGFFTYYILKLSDLSTPAKELSCSHTFRHAYTTHKYAHIPFVWYSTNF